MKYKIGDLIENIIWGSIGFIYDIENNRYYRMIWFYDIDNKKGYHCESCSISLIDTDRTVLLEK